MIIEHAAALSNEPAAISVILQQNSKILLVSEMAQSALCGGGVDNVSCALGVGQHGAEWNHSKAHEVTGADRWKSQSGPACPLRPLFPFCFVDLFIFGFNTIKSLLSLECGEA